MRRIALLWLMISGLTGCASVIGEDTIEWFARSSGEPGRIEQRYCASATPQTEDGSSPKRGSGYMTCGSDFEIVVKAVQAYCEEESSSKCMAVYYFDREKDTEIRSYEADNIARVARERRQTEIKEQAQERIRLTRICLGYGFKPKTQELANCVMQQAHHENELRVQQEANLRQRRVENAAKNAATEVDILRSQRFLDCLNRNTLNEICN